MEHPQTNTFAVLRLVIGRSVRPDRALLAPPALDYDLGLTQGVQDSIVMFVTKSLAFDTVIHSRTVAPAGFEVLRKDRL